MKSTNYCAGTGYLAFFFGTGTGTENLGTGTGTPGRENQGFFLSE